MGGEDWLREHVCCTEREWATHPFQYVRGLTRAVAVGGRVSTPGNIPMAFTARTTISATIFAF